MNCLLVSATPFEIAPFLDTMKRNEASGGAPVPDVLVTGIGLTATAYAVTRQLLLKKYDLAIQAGIGGCFDGRTALGSVLCIGREAIADQGVVENKELKTVFDMKLAPENRFPYTKGWLVNPHKEWIKATGVKTVKGISINEITTGRARTRLLEEKYGAVVESMEGAAFHMACLMEGVPFVQIRSVSNYIGERDKKKWRMREAIGNLNEALGRLIVDR
ncbi:MAG: futalosine hydrolase [Bacteroidetes bacterium]|nr:futalosine hydrolase [Bacteroidota bacterium]